MAQGCSSTSTHKLKGMGLRELFGAAAGTALVDTGDVHGARSAHKAFSFPTHPPGCDVILGSSLIRVTGLICEGNVAGRNHFCDYSGKPHG